MTSARTRFLAGYALERPALVAAASRARLVVEEILKNEGMTASVFQGRAKSHSSVAEKLYRKHYRNPRRDLTDLIGVRVVTFYAAEVPEVVEALKRRLTIDRKRSEDMRTTLGREEFGYVSHHLIARLQRAAAREEANWVLRNRWFEVQVRSLLQHAWAEIDHQVVYKADSAFPDEALRGFAAAAGALELLDREFLRLTSTRDERSGEYLDRLRKHQRIKGRLNVPMLTAALEYCFPLGEGFRWPDGKHRVLPPSTESACLYALRAVGIKEVRTLVQTLKSKRVMRRVRQYALFANIGQEAVSRFAVVGTVVALLKPRVFRDLFPQLLADPGFDFLPEGGGSK